MAHTISLCLLFVFNLGPSPSRVAGREVLLSLGLEVWRCVWHLPSRETHYISETSLIRNGDSMGVVGKNILLGSGVR